MAININAPILPIGSKGAFEFKPKNRWYMKPGKVSLNVGEIIYIPGYWWYSIKYEKLSSVCSFQYRAYSIQYNENRS